MDTSICSFFPRSHFKIKYFCKYYKIVISANEKIKIRIFLIKSNFSLLNYAFFAITNSLMRIVNWSIESTAGCFFIKQNTNYLLHFHLVWFWWKKLFLFQKEFLLQSNMIYRPPLNSNHLPTTTTSFRIRFQFVSHTATSERRPPLLKGNKFGVPRVVVVRRIDCIS